jgi:hypothetical protein
VKVFYIFICLPLLLGIMGLLILQMNLIYGLFLVSFLSFLGSIGYVIYLLTVIFNLSNDEFSRKTNLISNLNYLFIVFFNVFLSIAIFSYLVTNKKTIHYLVIKNSWIWWSNKVVEILAYPKKAGKIVLVE